MWSIYIGLKNTRRCFHKQLPFTLHLTYVIVFLIKFLQNWKLNHKTLSKTLLSLVKYKFCTKCLISLKPSICYDKWCYKIETIVLWRLKLSVTTPSALITSVQCTAFKEASDLTFNKSFHGSWMTILRNSLCYHSLVDV